MNVPPSATVIVVSRNHVAIADGATVPVRAGALTLVMFHRPEWY